MLKTRRPNKISHTVAEVNGRKYTQEISEKHIRVVQEEKKDELPKSDFFRVIAEWIFGKDSSK